MLAFPRFSAPEGKSEGPGYGCNPKSPGNWGVHTPHFGNHLCISDMKAATKIHSEVISLNFVVFMREGNSICFKKIDDS